MRRKILTIISAFFLTTIAGMLFPAPIFAASTSSASNSPSTLISPDGSGSCTGDAETYYDPDFDPTRLHVNGYVDCIGSVRTISITTNLDFCDTYDYAVGDCLHWVQVANAGSSCTSTTQTSYLCANYAYVHGKPLWRVRSDWCVLWLSGSQDCSTATKEQWVQSTSSDTFVHSVVRSSSSSEIPWFEPGGWTAGYVILHYQIPNQEQENVYMSYNSSTMRWESTINGLRLGTAVTYSFTYQRNGLQYDTDWSTWRW
jgi:hypothetical protein